jgi:hypothetical protein
MILAVYAVFFADGFRNTQHSDMVSLRTSAYPSLPVFYR